jgi:4-hydroxy-tetrahydrodipicolinate synthase
MLNNRPILWTALITPFDATGTSINYQEIETLLREQEAAGNGVVLLGSTGEGLLVSDAERKELVSFAFGLNLAIPLMVSVPSVTLPGALAWLDFFKDFPVAGYLMAPPVYTKPGVKGQAAWFKALLDVASAPVMLYNIPSRSGVRLHPESVKLLAGHPRLWAIKNSGDVESVADYLTAAPDVQLYCGDDNMMPAMSAQGAVGLISIASNVWPEATHRYAQLCLSEKCPEPNVWWNSTKVFGLASNPIPIKALMHQVGKIASGQVRLPLHQEDLASVQPLVAAHEAITVWMKNHG